MNTFNYEKLSQLQTVKKYLTGFKGAEKQKTLDMIMNELKCAYSAEAIFITIASNDTGYSNLNNCFISCNKYGDFNNTIKFLGIVMPQRVSVRNTILLGHDSPKFKEKNKTFEFVIDGLREFGLNCPINIVVDRGAVAGKLVKKD